MDRYLRGVANGIDKEKPVRYFVMGDSTWRDADSWPPPATPVEYYLNAPPAGSNRGTISREKPAHRQLAAFVSDPGNPVLNAYDSSGAHDYRKLAERSDVLLFDSAPMERDLEVTGPIAVKIFGNLQSPVLQITCLQC